HVAPASPRPHPATVAPVRPAPPPPPPPATLHVDSLPWTIQPAAYGTFEKALALADRPSDARRPAFTAPNPLPGRAPGPSPSRDPARRLAPLDHSARGVRPVREGARVGRSPVRRAPSGVHRPDRARRPCPRHRVVPRPRRRLPESRFGGRGPHRPVAAWR